MVQPQERNIQKGKEMMEQDIIRHKQARTRRIDILLLLPHSYARECVRGDVLVRLEHRLFEMLLSR